MKKLFVLIVIIVFSLNLCACQRTTPTESNNSNTNISGEYKTTLIRNLTASEDVSNIESFKIEYKNVAEAVFITNKDDLMFLKEYTYGGDFPTDRLHELYVYPPHCLITVNESIKLYLLEDGSIAKQVMCGDSGVPESERTYEIYTASEENRLMENKIISLIDKYE